MSEESNARESVRTLTTYARQSVGPTDEREIVSNIALRERVARYLFFIFIGTNAAVLIAIACFALIDYHFNSELTAKVTEQPAVLEKLIESPGLLEKSRCVNSNVLMSLIAATTVQVGAGVLTITQYLFPRGKESVIDK